MSIRAMSHAPSEAWLLALHSSSESLGVARQPLGEPETSPEVKVFTVGRGLANSLLTCVEAVLPASQWPNLARLAVATGPGGFTSTRLTVALARTLSQQLGLPLDGMSSFHLIARRLLHQQPPGEPFILSQQLPRHGVVAGLYASDSRSPGGVGELSPPTLYRNELQLKAELGPHGQVTAETELPADVQHLLAFGQAAAHLGLAAPWASVVPHYPTSPVERP